MSCTRVLCQKVLEEHEVEHRSDIVAIGRGGVPGWQGIGARSSKPAVASGVAAGAGSEGEESVEWQLLTRVRPSAVDGGEDLQQVTPTFVGTAAAIGKRKAEDSVNNKLTAMAATVTPIISFQNAIRCLYIVQMQILTFLRYHHLTQPPESRSLLSSALSSVPLIPESRQSCHSPGVVLDGNDTPCRTGYVPSSHKQGNCDRTIGYIFPCCMCLSHITKDHTRFL